MAGTTTSIILVLLVGNFCGALVKGITGFGSAIIHLCIWIAATCAGIESGTLQQAVLTECIASEVLAAPLLLMTRAHATCDWTLVLSLSVFGALSAPLGAAMLTHLPPRQVEFAIGCLMLLVILLNLSRQRRSSLISQDDQQKLRCDTTDSAVRDSAAQQAASDTAGDACLDYTQPSPLIRQRAALGIEVAVPAADAVPQVNGTPDCSLARDFAPTISVSSAATCSTPVQRSCSRSSTTDSSSDLPSEAQCICIISSSEEACWDGSAGDEERVALLVPAGDQASVEQPMKLQPQTMPSAVGQPAAAASSHDCSTSASCCARTKSAVLAWWASIKQPDRLAALRRMLLMGSLAGTASGVMGGLTGMGGPPVMLMYERLQVPKETVRGTNAVCNLAQVRIFAYVAMGVFSRADACLYIVVSVGAVVGMLLGCLLAARTNQAMFSRILTTLMVACCVLMFASAAGIAGEKLPAKHNS